MRSKIGKSVTDFFELSKRGGILNLDLFLTS